MIFHKKLDRRVKPRGKGWFVSRVSDKEMTAYFAFFTAHEKQTRILKQLSKSDQTDHVVVGEDVVSLKTQ